ncbi:ABC-F family ATP-binding cassette domain-containing protein [Devosia sp. SL43]|uniref:ABC-F family ATP-binding cassette domain-containing protein n=1 Tax=Devosia sp. SL43 TaxID=2806348 RepID=UPI001F364609|nr:ABC-F family ATP-binding cassette domain-containing protein [Devosia sp. SL43]UJW86629.1 ABC-F family ATP-binding cassette domain-containing protein [Devosia sp. SL43]
MSASVSLHQLSYSTPDGQPLFTDLELSFGAGRTGLIGRNGTGKSTLLRIIDGEIEPASGTVLRNATLGMLRQSVQADSDQTVAEALGVRPALERLDRLEQGTGTLNDGAEADWTLPGRIESALNSCGLPPLDSERAIATLSGGQRTRLALAALILGGPDIILLDEPTNNLDAEGRNAVVELLHRWRGAAIVVSHDRALLREMDAIVELTTLGATTYGGNWDHYAERKALELAAAAHGLASAERQVADIDRKIQAQAERKARKDGAGARKGGIPRILLGGMKENAENSSGENARLANRQRSDATQAASEARAKVEILTPLTVKLASSNLPAGRTVLVASGLTGGPEGIEPVIRDFNLSMTGPERVAITGPNGSGKTTLLRLLTGDLRPIAGHGDILVPYALLDQTVSLLDPTLSIRDNFRRLNPAADENTGRAALARFMFRADAALQIVGTLSGGEMLRAGLACTIGGNSPPQLLILDEPANHLDIQAVEELEAGLRGYDGALLVISHDRDFLSAISVERTISLAPV